MQAIMGTLGGLSLPRFRVGLITVLGALLVSTLSMPSAAEAKGASIIVVHGGSLDGPIILSDLQENLQFGASTSERVRMSADELDGRAFIEITQLWGSGWREIVEDEGRWDELPLDAGNPVNPGAFSKWAQWDRLYVGTDSEPPILTTNRGARELFWGFRIVESPALLILESHGVTRDMTDPSMLAPIGTFQFSEAPPRALPNTGSGGLADEGGGGVSAPWLRAFAASGAALIAASLLTWRHRAG